MIAALAFAVFAASALASDIRLTWRDNSDNEAGFRIERSSARESWKQIASVGKNSTSYIDTDARPDILYSYRIRAFNKAGSSGYSNTASARLLALAADLVGPRIAAIANQSVPLGTTAHVIPIKITSMGVNPSGPVVKIASSNSAVVPLSALQLNGTGTSRTLTVDTSAARAGSTTITITISDGALVTKLNFEVKVAVTEAAPVFTVAPASTHVGAGAQFVLRAAAKAPGTVAYQWLQNGNEIAGATSPELVIPSAQRFHAGSYRVRATSAGLSVMSENATVTVDSAKAGNSRLLNLSTRAWCGKADNVLIPGLVVSGTGTKHLLIRAVGPTLTLAPFNIPVPLPNPRLTLKTWTGRDYANIAQSTDWSSRVDTKAVQTAAAAVGAFELPGESRDAALLVSLSPGQFTMVVDDEADRKGVSLVELYDVDPNSSGASLSNLSNRGYVGTGENVMILGFVISQEGPLTLLLRAIGPQLAGAPYHVAGALADPIMEIYGADGSGEQRLILSNDNWEDNPDHDYTASVSAGLATFPLLPGGRDAALVATLLPGAYTLIVRGAPITPGGNPDVGVALMELYTAP